jgi:hypothetical protein
MPDGRHCPACSAPLDRVHRHAVDRWVSLFRSVHRYRCIDPACGWEGVLGRDRVGAADEMRWPALAMTFVAGAVAALLVVQAVRIVQHRANEKARAVAAQVKGVEAHSRATPAGVDFRGVPLADEDERVRSNPSPLQLRHSCAWGVPGGNPYRGTVAQALAAARLPPEVVRRIADMAERGWVYDQVEISREGIQTVSGQRRFGTDVRAMAFGDTLCFNTRVNFAPGHVEYAALYEAEDAAGKRYTVMVPYVCQNVSVLGEREEIVESQNIPEPTSWTLVLAGLALLAAARAVRSRQHRG